MRGGGSSLTRRRHPMCLNIQPILAPPAGAEPVKVASEPVAVPAPRKAPAITDCPAVLDRPEAGDRVIAGSCAPVTVRKGYRVESGSLTLEAGAQLAFEPGAELTVGYQKPGQLIVRGTAEKPVLEINPGHSLVRAVAGDPRQGVRGFQA